MDSFFQRGGQRETERATVLAAVCRRKVTVNRSSLTPFVRITPMGHGGTPRTDNASEDGIGDAAFTSETDCRSSVFLIAIPE